MSAGHRCWSAAVQVSDGGEGRKEASGGTLCVKGSPWVCVSRSPAQQVWRVSFQESGRHEMWCYSAICEVRIISCPVWGRCRILGPVSGVFQGVQSRELGRGCREGYFEVLAAWV